MLIGPLLSGALLLFAGSTPAGSNLETTPLAESSTGVETLPTLREIHADTTEEGLRLGAHEPVRYADESLADLAAWMGTQLGVSASLDGSLPPLTLAAGSPRIQLPPDRAEGAFLSLEPGGWCLRGHDHAGVRWAAQSLATLAQDPEARGTSMSFTAQDWPSTPYRWVSLDLHEVREFPIGLVDRWLEQLARWKFNGLILRLHGNFQFDHLQAGRKGALTSAQARALGEKARSLGIDLIPHVDVLGDIAILHGPYRELRDDPGIENVLSLAAPGTMPLLSRLVDDLCEAFPSDVVYLGTTWPREGFRHPRDQGELQRALQLLLDRMIDRLSQHGRRLMIDAEPLEVLPGLGAALVKKPLVLRRPRTRAMAENLRSQQALIEAGFDVIAAAPLKSSFHVPGDERDAERMHVELDQLLEGGSLGGCYFVDGVGEGRSPDDDWFELARFAERLWTGKTPSVSVLERRFARSFLGVSSADVGRGYRQPLSLHRRMGLGVGRGLLGPVRSPWAKAEQKELRLTSRDAQHLAEEAVRLLQGVKVTRNKSAWSARLRSLCYSRHLALRWSAFEGASSAYGRAWELAKRGSGRWRSKAEACLGHLSELLASFDEVRAHLQRHGREPGMDDIPQAALERERAELVGLIDRVGREIVMAEREGRLADPQALGMSPPSMSLVGSWGGGLHHRVELNWPLGRFEGLEGRCDFLFEALGESEALGVLDVMLIGRNGSGEVVRPATLVIRRDRSAHWQVSAIQNVDGHEWTLRAKLREGSQDHGNVFLCGRR